MRDLLAQVARGEVLAHRLPGSCVPEVPLEEPGGLVEQRVQAVAPVPCRLRLRRGLLVRELDAEALGEELDRADEVEVLDITHEADRVPAAVAAVAVVELVDRV